MLNDEQRRAVESNAPKICVLAAAGSGKTTVLVERLLRLRSEGVDPNKILVLTFTNAAAKEMKQRYVAKSDPSAIPTFGTFHAFCYSLIIKDSSIRAFMGYSAIPKLATPMEEGLIFQMAQSKSGTKLRTSTLEKPRSQMHIKDLFDYDIFWKTYDRLFKQKNLITFKMMADDVQELFKTHNTLVQKYVDQYSYVFCDEHQDTSNAEWEFVKSFTNANLFVVGDAKQNLYSFRGTTNRVIKSLADDPEWETIILPLNYRSTIQICEYANSIHRDWEESKFNIQMKSLKSGEEIFKFDAFDFNSPDDILKIRDMSQGFKTTAILCRTNAEVAEMKSTMDRYGVSYVSNTIDTDTPNILRSSVDNDYMVDWLSSLLPAEDHATYLRLSMLSDNFTPKDFIQTFRNKFPYIVSKIMQLRQCYANTHFDGEDPTFINIMLSEVVRILKLPIIPEYTVETEIKPAILELADDLSLNIAGDSSIYVGTIHSSKGLEYDVVHLIGVNGRHFNVHRDEDNENCYYVGCTRAKSRLCLWFGDCEENEEQHRW